MKLNFTPAEIKTIITMYDENGEINYVKFIEYASKFLTNKKFLNPEVEKLKEQAKVSSEILEYWTKVCVNVIIFCFSCFCYDFHN